MTTHQSSAQAHESMEIEPWPHCASIGGTCLAYEMGQAVGEVVESALLTFMVSADDGSRLTLQKNRDGFTVQVTGAVGRATGGTFGLPEVQALRKRLDELVKG